MAKVVEKALKNKPQGSYGRRSGPPYPVYSAPMGRRSGPSFQRPGLQLNVLPVVSLATWLDSVKGKNLFWDSCVVHNPPPPPPLEVLFVGVLLLACASNVTKRLCGNKVWNLLIHVFNTWG